MLINTHAPLTTRVITIRPKTPWYNNEMSDAKQQFRREERRWRETWLVVRRDIFTTLRNLCKNQLVTAKSAYHCQEIQESARDVKAMYRVTNNIMGRKLTPTLPENNGSHADLAERFLVYFFDKIAKIRRSLNYYDALPPLPQIDNNHEHCTLSAFTWTTAIIRLVNKS